MKLELKTKSWENLFLCIRNSRFEAEGNFWAAVQQLEVQFEEQTKANLKVVNESLSAINVSTLKDMVPGKVFAEGRMRDDRVCREE